MKHVDVTSYHPVPALDGESLMFRCAECDIDIEVTDLDTHAKNAHKSSHLRTFISETAYVTWKKEQS